MRVRGVRAGMAGLAVTAGLVLAGCATSGTSGTGARGPASPGAGANRNLIVFAAASLTETFTRIGRDFEAADPGTTITFNFAGSSALATQINQGAPADVFASASPTNMDTVTGAGNAAGTPTTFARNQLVIAVPKGNPAHITGLADLAKPGVKLAQCAAQVPCGAAATKALAAAGIRLTPVTLEQDVKSALSKVKLGEVDAALVYRTDARSAASSVDGIEFPESAKAVNSYPIVVLRQARDRTAAQAFVAYVLSGKGMSMLSAAGFQAP